jgi:HK97 family phage major capsid protein
MRDLLLSGALWGSRIDADGNYHPPTICYLDDDAPLTAKDIEDLKSDLNKVGEHVKVFAEDLGGKIKAGQEITQSLKDDVDKALSEQGNLRARLDEAEQKLVRRSGGNDPSAQHMTPGQMFIANDDVKKFMTERPSRGRVRMDLATITTGNIGATRDVLVPPDRQGGFIALPQRRLTVRDLITPGRTSSNAVQYVRETGFTNRAAVVSEGAVKPESDITFELKTVPVATIAHVMRAAKQILDDAPALQSHIDGRLRYGVAYDEDTELLLGDGTGVHLFGIIPQATAYAGAFVPAQPTVIDTLRLAHLQSELALFPSTGQVLNPTDWARIELTKDTQGRYIFADVQGNATPRMWGRPVVSTPAMSVDKFLVGAFMLGAQIFDREDANVEISTEDQDNFVRNLVTLRGEERLALCVYRPEAFIYGDFGLVT